MNLPLELRIAVSLCWIVIMILVTKAAYTVRIYL